MANPLKTEIGSKKSTPSERGAYLFSRAPFSRWGLVFLPACGIFLSKNAYESGHRIEAALAALITAGFIFGYWWGRARFYDRGFEIRLWKGPRNDWFPWSSVDRLTLYIMRGPRGGKWTRFSIKSGDATWSTWIDGSFARQIFPLLAKNIAEEKMSEEVKRRLHTRDPRAWLLPGTFGTWHLPTAIFGAIFVGLGLPAMLVPFFDNAKGPASSMVLLLFVACLFGGAYGVVWASHRMDRWVQEKKRRS